jgi:hypothetical protein
MNEDAIYTAEKAVTTLDFFHSKLIFVFVTVWNSTVGGRRG